MKVLDQPQDLSLPPTERTILTVGTFDGLHRGHQSIIARVVEESRVCPATSLVYTFHPHPYYIMRERSERFLVTTEAERLHLMDNLGVAVVVRQQFGREFAAITAEEFIQEIILPYLRPAKIITGFSHAFGRGGQGSPDLLHRLGKDLGFEVEVVPPVLEGNEKVNSTTIRHYIKNGQMRKTNAMLGRSYQLAGTVVKGAGRGQGLAFPTANVLPYSDRKLIPGDGIYAGLMRRKGKTYPGVIYCGSRPTFESGKVKHVEIHLWGLDESLYGEEVIVEFLAKLRNDQAFKNPEDLVKQMEQDKQEAQRFFQGLDAKGAS